MIVIIIFHRRLVTRRKIRRENTFHALESNIRSTQIDSQLKKLKSQKTTLSCETLQDLFTLELLIAIKH